MNDFEEGEEYGYDRGYREGKYEGYKEGMHDAVARLRGSLAMTYDEGEKAARIIGEDY